MFKGNQGSTVVVFVILVVMLSGCMYPKELRKDNQTTARDGILLVQNAVDEYQRKTELLPLMTADENVPRYEKYEVDFQVLLSHQLLSAIPKDAFESGGHHRYIILNEESKPTVRALDLNTAQRANDLERKSLVYQEKHGKLPLGEETYPGFFKVDEKALNMNNRPVPSPYSGEQLQFLLTEEGKVYADYAPDLMKAIEQLKVEPTAEDEDLRPLLIEAGLFSPVKSARYQWKNDMPVPVN